MSEVKVQDKYAGACWNELMENESKESLAAMLMDLRTENSSLIERIARAEAQLKEAKAGWDSCIADLRKAAEICREAEAQLSAQHILMETKEAERKGWQELADKAADEVVTLRSELSKPVTDEEWTEFYQVTPMGREVMERERINQWLASRVKKGIAHLGSAASTGDASLSQSEEV